MTKTKGARIATVLGMAIALGAGTRLAGQDPGPGTRTGQKLDEAGQSIKKGLEQARDALKDQFARARSAVHSMGVETRVYGRLHWDKALNNSTLDIEVNNDVVTLRGTVADARAKARAVDLARETVGISQVIDQLAIAPPSQPAPGSSTGPTTRP
jgi:hypothetical protein